MKKLPTKPVSVPIAGSPFSTNHSLTTSGEPQTLSPTDLKQTTANGQPTFATLAEKPVPSQKQYNPRQPAPNHNDATETPWAAELTQDQVDQVLHALR